MQKSLLVIILILISTATVACTETATKLNKQARLALNVKNYDEAITLLKRSVALEPDNCKTYHLLGMGYKEKGEIDEAISAYQRGLELNPNEIVTLCLLGDIYLTKGMIDDAITISRKAISLDPEAQVAHYNLGIAYKMQGKNTIAARHLFEAGLLAFIKSSKDLAVKSYRALKEIGPEQTTQELYELLEPFLTPDSKAVNPS